MPPFGDVPDTHPDSDAIAYAVAKGWFRGYKDGTFRPDTSITGDHIDVVLRRAFPNGSTRADMATFLVGGAAAVSGWEHIGQPFWRTQGFYLRPVPGQHSENQSDSRLIVHCDESVTDVLWIVSGDATSEGTAHVEYQVSAGEWEVAGDWLVARYGVVSPRDPEGFLHILTRNDPALLSLRTRWGSEDATATFDISAAGIVIRTVSDLCSRLRSIRRLSTLRPIWTHRSRSRRPTSDMRHGAAGSWVTKMGRSAPTSRSALTRLQR